MYIEGHSRCKMGIEKIKSHLEGTSSPKMQTNYQTKNRTYLKTGYDSTSFTGAGGSVKPLQDFLLDKMPWLAKKMVKIHSGMGEVQNQIINALGTGLIAPIFIMFNPLSDKDQDTKTYTAMRQPISAILAVATQAAIVIPFNSMIKKAADIGFLPMQYNSTLFPSDDYVEKLVKKANPGVVFKKDKKHDIDELKDAIEAYKKEHYEKPLVEMIYNNDKIVFNATDGKTVSKLEMPKEDFKKLFMETIDNIIKEEEVEKVNAIKNKLSKKAERGIFFHNNPEDSLSVLQRLDNKIGTYMQQSDFGLHEDAVKQAHKEFDKECDRVVRGLKRSIGKHPEKEAVNNELIKIVKEIKQCNADENEEALRLLKAKINKIMDSVRTMSSMKSTEDIVDYVNGSVYRRTNAIDGTLETLKEIRTKLETSDISVREAQEIVDKAIAESDKKVKAENPHISNLKNSVEQIESAGTRLREKVKSIAKCIVDQQKKHAKSNIDGLKRWTGLGVSLAILPVTCWLLNKIYPWAMDRLFPSLSASKKDTQDKKVEVA